MSRTLLGFVHKGMLFAGVVAAALMAVPSPAAAHQGACIEIFNPHGKTVPPAGNTTLPGPNGGQNEDGFYWVGACRYTQTLVCPSAGLGGPIDWQDCYCADSEGNPVELWKQSVTLQDGCPGETGGGTFEQYINPDTGTNLFPFGTTVKCTEANGADINIEAMAGSKQAGTPAGDSSDSVNWHLWGQGDLWVCPESGDGCVCCHVPPPPK